MALGTLHKIFGPYISNILLAYKNKTTTIESGQHADTTIGHTTISAVNNTTTTNTTTAVS
jgi:hypothetical protein